MLISSHFLTGVSPKSVLIPDAEDWLLQLADALANQHLPSVRLSAYHKLLEATTISDGLDNAPSASDRKLSRAVTAFVIGQLGQRGFRGLGQAAGTEEEERKAQEGYVALMEQVRCQRGFFCRCLNCCVSFKEWIFVQLMTLMRNGLYVSSWTSIVF